MLSYVSRLLRLYNRTNFKRDLFCCGKMLYACEWGASKDVSVIWVGV